MACPGCEVVTPLEQEGRLFLAAELAHTRNKIRTRLAEADIDSAEPLPGIVAVDVQGGDMEAVTRVLGDALTVTEQDSCRTLMTRQSEAFGLELLTRMRPLRVLIARDRGRWLEAMLREERFLVHFQPILPVSGGRTPFAYECLIRGQEEDGRMVAPGALFGVARSAELVFHLDRAARMAAIRQADAYGIDTMLFINFNPTSIYDPDFCLRSTIAAQRRSSIPSDKLVFEVVESDSVFDDSHLMNILREYRNAGYRVALDDLGAGYGSLNLLSRMQPDFVKLDMALIRDVDQDDYKAALLRGVIGAVRDVGAAIVAEGVESAGEWAWLQEHKVDYVQGYHFARPAAPPPLLGDSTGQD